jgi:lipopolysaccharide biosynthesis glycosyltransferase
MNPCDKQDCFITFNTSIVAPIGLFVNNFFVVFLQHKYPMNKIFVGFDPSQEVAYQTCKKSLNREVIPLDQDNLRSQGIYNRVDTNASTPFSLTRFLVPYLSNYEGWSLFCDSDFLWMCDVDEVFQLADDRYSVMCVQHDYTPKTSIKMMGQTQHIYPRKNWSSLMLFNNKRCEILNPTTVNVATPGYLHRFQWLFDSEIGSIPIEYNWLVGYYQETETFKPKALHYTDGGPWLENYKDCEYSDLWKRCNPLV